MTDEEIIKGLQAVNEHIGKHFNEGVAWMAEFIDNAIQALEQESITWIVGKDNCQVAVRNMPIDKMQKICAIIGEEEQQPTTGHWIVIREEFEFMGGIVNEPRGCKCSNCNKVVRFKSDFCPNCGADMRESEEWAKHDLRTM
jgi:NADH pyrophosphatase NudC (nudix superfamily)